MKLLSPGLEKRPLDKLQKSSIIVIHKFMQGVNKLLIPGKIPHNG